MKTIIMIITFLSLQALAQSSTDSKAVRIYPGGVDEDNLEVQESLPQPYSNVNKSAIVKQIYKEFAAKSEK